MDSEYKDIVDAAALAAAGAGVPGTFTPGFDLVAIGGIWTSMMVAIAEKSGHEVDRAFAAKTISAVGAGIVAYSAGSKILTFGLLTIPGAGWITAVTMNGALNYWYTKRLGKALAEMFGRPNLQLKDANAVARALVPALGRWSTR